MRAPRRSEGQRDQRRTWQRYGEEYLEPVVEDQQVGDRADRDEQPASVAVEHQQGDVGESARD